MSEVTQFNVVCWQYYHPRQGKWFPCEDAWHAVWCLNEGDQIRLSDYPMHPKAGD